MSYQTVERFDQVPADPNPHTWADRVARWCSRPFSVLSRSELRRIFADRDHAVRIADLREAEADRLHAEVAELRAELTEKQPVWETETAA